MMETPISRAEHEEFVRRMESENKRLSDEDKRQNRRLDALETDVREIKSLTMSVERLATSMEAMQREQKDQGARLAALEQKPGKRWDGLMDKIIYAVAIAFVAWLAAGLPGLN